MQVPNNVDHPPAPAEAAAARERIAIGLGRQEIIHSFSNRQPKRHGCFHVRAALKALDEPLYAIFGQVVFGQHKMFATVILAAQKLRKKVHLGGVYPTYTLERATHDRYDSLFN